MNIALFTAKSYDKYYFDQQLSETDHEITYFEDALNTDTAVLARGYDTVCVFVNNIISLHCPLMPETKHMIDKKAIDKMNDSLMLINTSRGALVKTSDVIDGLKEKKSDLWGSMSTNRRKTCSSRICSRRSSRTMRSRGS